MNYLFTFFLSPWVSKKWKHHSALTQKLFLGPALVLAYVHRSQPYWKSVHRLKNPQILWASCPTTPWTGPMKWCLWTIYRFPSLSERKAFLWRLSWDKMVLSKEIITNIFWMVPDSPKISFRLFSYLRTHPAYRCTHTQNGNKAQMLTETIQSCRVLVLSWLVEFLGKELDGTTLTAQSACCYYNGRRKSKC